MNAIYEYFDSNDYNGLTSDKCKRVLLDGMSSFLFGRHQWGCYSNAAEWAALNRFNVLWRISTTNDGWYLSRFGEKYGDQNNTHPLYLYWNNAWWVVLPDDYAYGPYATIKKAVAEHESLALTPIESCWLSQFIKQHVLKWTVAAGDSVDNFVFPSEKKDVLSSAIAKLTNKERFALKLAQ